jgi:hypothetical protein
MSLEHDGHKAALLAPFAMAALVSACASPPPPRFVRAADLGKLDPLGPDQPLAIESRKGT